MTVTQVCRHRSSALGGNSAWSLHVGSPWILSIRACLRDYSAKLVSRYRGVVSMRLRLRWDLGTGHLCGENSPPSVEVSRDTIASLWSVVSMLMNKQYQTEDCSSFTNSHLVMGPSKRSTIKEWLTFNCPRFLELEQVSTIFNNWSSNSTWRTCLSTPLIFI